MILLGSFWLVWMCYSCTKFDAVRSYDFISFPNFVTEIEYVCHIAYSRVSCGRVVSMAVFPLQQTSDQSDAKSFLKCTKEICHDYN